MTDSVQPEKKKNWFLRHPILTVLLVILVIGFIGMANGDSESSSSSTANTASNTKQEEKKEPQKESYKVGENIKLGKVIVTINQVEKSMGGQYTKPAEGNEWVELNMTIENTGNTQEFITTLGQMFILDSENNQYQVAVTSKALENPGVMSLDGAIVAGAKKTGWVGFEVPVEATGLKLQYNASSWGFSNVLVDLGE
jgi:hypothetical protein